jgi:mannose-1-phosphate guanylyltransferase
MIRQAFVLGAGLGTRLKALTQRRPKPLIPVANRPLITYAFDHLRGAGVEGFVVNTHWHAAAYDQAFPDRSYRDSPVNFRHEWPEVLETAGGLKNAEDLLSTGPFWVYNGDILSTLPLEPALRVHRAAANEVTMILRSHGGPLQVSFDETTGRIGDIGRELDPLSDPRFLFTGIYLVEPAFLTRIPPATKIGVIPIFREMIRAGAKLGGVVIDDGDWWDLGSREQYLAVHQSMNGAPWIDSSAQIAPGAQITGATAIGANARIGAGARLRDCLVWEGGEVAPGASLESCIVTTAACASGTLVNSDVV